MAAGQPQQRRQQQPSTHEDTAGRRCLGQLVSHGREAEAAADTDASWQPVTAGDEASRAQDADERDGARAGADGADDAAGGNSPCDGAYAAAATVTMTTTSAAAAADDDEGSYR